LPQSIRERQLSNLKKDNITKELGARVSRKGAKSTGFIALARYFARKEEK